MKTIPFILGIALGYYGIIYPDWQIAIGMLIAASVLINIGVSE